MSHLPFAPGELTLLAAGLLIAAGGLDPFVFIPVALIACIAGSLVGYTWARAVGDRGLQALARRIHQQRSLERVSGRVRSAGWGGIAVSRLIPGLRIYTTLVAGALRVRRTTFLLGMAPATAIWLAVYVALGVLVGVPIEHFFTAVQKLAIQGAILVAMGVGCYFLIRRTPASSGAGLVRVPRPVRVVIAAVLDIGVVASVTTGLVALARLLGFGLQAGWVDPVVALLVVAGFYVVIARRSSGATVGEALLQTSYATGQRLPLRRHAPPSRLLAPCSRGTQMSSARRPICSGRSATPSDSGSSASCSRSREPFPSLPHRHGSPPSRSATSWSAFRPRAPWSSAVRSRGWSTSSVRIWGAPWCSSWP